MIPLKKKNEEWKKDCMDVLEAIGRNQYYSSANLIENYEMIRGRFIYSHYLDREDYSDMINQMTREFEIPSHLRHYDIISQVINTLSGEYQKRPDVFKVKSNDDGAINSYVQQKTDLLVQFVQAQLDQSINAKLQAQGMNPADTQDPQVQQARAAMTPPEIERFMKTSWMDQGEIWAENQLAFDKQRFNLPEKEKVEFEDMLAADRCFRHFFLTANGYNQETWNPVNTFYHKSPEVNYIEKGDYVGRVFFLTVPEIINRYGHLMTEVELLTLEAYKKESYNAKGTSGETTYSGLTPNTVVPSWNFPEQHFVSNQLGQDPNNPEIIDMNIMSALGNKSATGDYNRRLFYQVTEAYWLSQRKMGKFVYKDPDTGKPTVMIVDETFDKKLFPGIKELDNAFMELGQDEQVNTITWTWVNQVWKGIKINNRFQAIKEPIYLDVRPNDFQFKGDTNIYGAKLPVCGQIFNNRNAESMSLVDLMKPHQIGHNVAMNQLYEIMQREIGRFVLMDLNLIPSSKDWGGDRNYEKFMMVAKQLGMGPIDSSQTNARQTNYQDIKMVDLDESARMISRTKIAEFFENCALKQVGITPQRLGETQASESATGVEQAVNQSFAQTESHFTNFSNYKRRCLQMNLEMAQYVQAKEGDIAFMYTASDMSRAFIKINGTDLILSEFGIFVEDSQEVARQLTMLRQMFMENNTTGATPPDLATVVTSNSPAEIKAQIKASYEQLMQNQQSQQTQQQQADQQKQQMLDASADKERAFLSQQKELDRANARYIAEINALGRAKDTDMNQDNVPDALEVQQFDLEQKKHTEDVLFKKSEMAHDMQKENRKMDLESQRIKLDRKTLDQQASENDKDRELEKEKIKSQEKIARSKPKPKS